MSGELGVDGWVDVEESGDDDDGLSCVSLALLPILTTRALRDSLISSIGCVSEERLTHRNMRNHSDTTKACFLNTFPQISVWT